MVHEKPRRVPSGAQMYIAQPQVDNVHQPQHKVSESVIPPCHVLPDARQSAEMQLRWRSILHCTDCGGFWFLDVSDGYKVHWKPVRWWHVTLRREVRHLKVRARGLQRRG